MCDSLTKYELLVVIYDTWHIWKKRCRRIFQQVILSEVQIVELIKDDLLLLGTHLLEITKEEVEIVTGQAPGSWE